MASTRSAEVALVCLSMLASARSLTLLDPNTCIREETFNITRNITVRQPISVKSYKWCLQVPPRCTTYRQEWRQVVESQVVPMTRRVVACCKGYNLDSEGACVPICTNGCYHGACIGPETCINRKTLQQISLPTTPNMFEYDKPSTSSPTTTNPVEALQIERSLQNITSNGVTEETAYNKFNATSLAISATEQNSERPIFINSTTNSRGYDFSNPPIHELVNESTIETVTQATHLQQNTKDFSKWINIGYHSDNFNEDLALNTSTEINLKGGEFHDHQDVSENIDTKSEMSKDTSTKRNLSGQRQENLKLLGDAANTVEQTAAKEPKKNSSDSTYSRTPIMHIGERFVYSITISVGIVLAIIVVTLIITKHQRYLEDISDKRNAEKFKAVHKADEQETSLQVVTYRVVRDTPPQPFADESITNSSTRNSTILVYNFPPPSSSVYDAPPVRGPLRTFGEYDVPSPTTENVYDEIPAHRNDGEAFKCCKNNSSEQESLPCSPFIIQFASLIANDAAASAMQPNS